MDFNTLKSEILTAYDRNTRMFMLAADRLSPGTRELIEDSIKQDPLVLTQAGEPVEAGETISFSGVSSILGFKEVSTTALFELVDDHAEMTLSLTPPAGWSFPD